MKHFFSQPRKVLIIGQGRMGKLVAKILYEHTNADVWILTRSKKKGHQIFNNWDNIPEVDLIIPCVPISTFTKIVKQIAKNVNYTTICMDLCSVKVHPVKSMQDNLPEHISIIATHPMFGPDSYKINKGLIGLTMVIWNISATTKDFDLLELFWQKLKLNAIRLSPEKHDQSMAKSLGFSYLVGKINNQLGITKTPIDTYDFKLLLEHAHIIASDNDQLFLDMQKYNPYAKKVRDKFLSACTKLIKKLNT